MDIYDGDRDVITLGPIIPDTPALYFTAEGNIIIFCLLDPAGGVRWRSAGAAAARRVDRHPMVISGFRRPTSESGKRFPAEPFITSQGFYAG